jgi:hypothetical protein
VPIARLAAAQIAIAESKGETVGGIAREA